MSSTSGLMQIDSDSETTTPILGNNNPILCDQQNSDTHETGFQFVLEHLKHSVDELADFFSRDYLSGAQKLYYSDKCIIKCHAMKADTMFRIPSIGDNIVNLYFDKIDGQTFDGDDGREFEKTSAMDTNNYDFYSRFGVADDTDDPDFVEYDFVHHNKSGNYVQDYLLYPSKTGKFTSFIAFYKGTSEVPIVFVKITRPILLSNLLSFIIIKGVKLSNIDTEMMKTTLLTQETHLKSSNSVVLGTSQIKIQTKIKISDKSAKTVRIVKKFGHSSDVLQNQRQKVHVANVNNKFGNILCAFEFDDPADTVATLDRPTEAEIMKANEENGALEVCHHQKLDLNILTPRIKSMRRNLLTEEIGESGIITDY